MSAPLISFRARVFALVGIEAIAWILTQHVLAQLPWTSPLVEAIRTVVRLETLVFDWYLFRGLILAGPAASAQQPGSRAIRAAAVLMLLAPLAAGGIGLPPPATVFFALTSIVVAAKEEVLFRAIVQRLLVARLGATPAVVVTSLLFAAWHAGAVPLTWLAAGEIFLASAVLGLVYLRCASLAAVIWLHAAYDALYVVLPAGYGIGPASAKLAPLALALLVLAQRPGQGGRRRKAPQAARGRPHTAAPSFSTDASCAAWLPAATPRRWLGPVRAQQPNL